MGTIRRQRVTSQETTLLAPEASGPANSGYYPAHDRPYSFSRLTGRPSPQLELAEILATAYLRLRQRDHKSRIQATLDQKIPVLLSCYRVPPE